MARYVLLADQRGGLATFECEHCGLLTRIPADELPAHRGKPERPMHDCPALGGLSVPISEKFPR